MKSSLKMLIALCLMAADFSALAQTMNNPDVLAASYDIFGLRLFAQMRQAEPGKNVFLSPAGMAICLSMAGAGAQGKTLEQMKAVLEVTPVTSDLNLANQWLIKRLTDGNARVELEIANSLWVAQDAKIKPSFLSIIEGSYGAGAVNVNFKDPATADKINNWVDQNTHGKIQKMVQPPLNVERLILLNVIYFKGWWAKPFDLDLTRDMPFTLIGGQTINHPRMSITTELNYFDTDSFQAVILPYEGMKMRMFVFLPKKSLDDFVQNLSLENWSHWLGKFRFRRGTVELPRFKLQNEYEFNDVLKVMGMTDAFTNRRANFNGISDEGLYIDWVRQKTFLYVNETGTEAAGVNGMSMTRGTAIHRAEVPPFHMVVDHPFFVAISDQESGAILFLGTIVDPRS